MSSTRRAKDDSVFHQARYSSSPEFERGLVALPVAKRCSILTDKSDRELIWFIHHLSHGEAGLTGLAKHIVENYTAKLGTPAMIAAGKVAAQSYNFDEVKKIRLQFPKEIRLQFILQGELEAGLEHDLEIEKTATLNALGAEFDGDSDERARCMTIIESNRKAALAAAGKYPRSYPVESFLEICRKIAKDGCELYGWKTPNLEDELREFCLKPVSDLRDCCPWYFDSMLDVLREYYQQWIAEKAKRLVTSLGAKVFYNLDYALESRSLFLMEGNARLGKSFAAKAWCELHPGQVRFVEVPPYNDDAGFFRALARGLGLGNFLNYKSGEIRERVECVLHTGDLMLVLDEAQRLWPEHNLKRGHPSRIIWVMTMVNAGVPIGCISTPQFIQSQKAMDKAGWNSDQLTGRNGGYEFLPKELSDDDFMAVARLELPTASENVLKGIAIYARASDRHLAAVETIAKRARFTAKREGRLECTDVDISRAMALSVVPSDTALKMTLAPAAKETKKRRRSDLPMETPVLVDREISPLIAPAGRRSDARAELQEEEI